MVTCNRYRKVESVCLRTTEKAAESQQIPKNTSQASEVAGSVSLPYRSVSTKHFPLTVNEKSKSFQTVDQSFLTIQGD